MQVTSRMNSTAVYWLVVSFVPNAALLWPYIAQNQFSVRKFSSVPSNKSFIHLLTSAWCKCVPGQVNVIHSKKRARHTNMRRNNIKWEDAASMKGRMWMWRPEHVTYNTSLSLLLSSNLHGSIWILHVSLLSYLVVFFLFSFVSCGQKCHKLKEDMSNSDITQC